MANVKITDLTAYTNPDSTDVLPIVDVGADITKKISIQDLLENAGSGTAAAPGIAFDGDPNTGIYSPGADQLALSTGGTGRLFVDASGNLLVGANANSGGLGERVSINGAGLVTQSAAQTNRGLFGNFGGSTQIIGAFDNIPLEFRTNNTERLRITSAGLVGIGTSSPGSLLDLAGGDIRLNSVYGINKSNADGYIHFSGGTSNALGGTIFCFGQSHISNANEIHFRNSGNQTRVAIDSSGNVGIGTTSPGETLSLIEGTALGWNDTSGNNAARIYANSGDELRFERGSINSRSMTIDSSGRLLVGTSSDSGGALLQVNGNRIRVATARTPSSASDTGTAGEICWDASYIYVCTATDTWKRAALSTW